MHHTHTAPQHYKFGRRRAHNTHTHTHIHTLPRSTTSLDAAVRTTHTHTHTHTAPQHYKFGRRRVHTLTGIDISSGMLSQAALRVASDPELQGAITLVQVGG